MTSPAPCLRHGPPGRSGAAARLERRGNRRQRAGRRAADRTRVDRHGGAAFARSSRGVHFHRLPCLAGPRRDVQSECGEGGAGPGRLCALFQPRADSLGAGCVGELLTPSRRSESLWLRSRRGCPLRVHPSPLTARWFARFPPYRHLRLPRRFPENLRQSQPAAIEQFEALEQLRALWHGYRISVALAAVAPAAGVDTMEDLERVRRLFGR